ncbi:hypothetical protein D3C75_744430 [compost metagenome]
MQDGHLAIGQLAHQLGTFGRVNLVEALGQLAGVGAVAGQQADRAEDADRGAAFVQAAAGLLAQGLQAVEVDVDGQGGDHLAVDCQREDDAGHQHLLAIDVVEVGLHHAHLAGCARAHPPGIGWLAAGADLGVGHVMLGQGHGRQLADTRLRPVQGEAPGFIAAQFRLAGEQAVLVVQGVGLEHQRQAEQLRVGLQGGAHLAGHVLAQVEGIEKALFRLLAQEQHLAGETGAVLVGVHELAADVQRLHLALRLDARLRRLGQHLHAAGLDQVRAVVHAVQRQADEQGDDAGQAETGEQGDLPLDGKLSQRHGGGSLFWH